MQKTGNAKRLKKTPEQLFIEGVDKLNLSFIERAIEAGLDPNTVILKPQNCEYKNFKQMWFDKRPLTIIAMLFSLCKKFEDSNFWDYSDDMTEKRVKKIKDFSKLATEIIINAGGDVKLRSGSSKQSLIIEDLFKNSAKDLYEILLAASQKNILNDLFKEKVSENHVNVKRKF